MTATTIDDTDRAAARLDLARVRAGRSACLTECGGYKERGEYTEAELDARRLYLGVLQRSRGRAELHFLEGLLYFVAGYAKRWTAEHGDGCECRFCALEDDGSLEAYREDLSAAAWAARSAADPIGNSQVPLAQWKGTFAAHWAQLCAAYARAEALRQIEPASCWEDADEAEGNEIDEQIDAELGARFDRETRAAIERAVAEQADGAGMDTDVEEPAVVEGGAR